MQRYVCSALERECMTESYQGARWSTVQKRIGSTESSSLIRVGSCVQCVSNFTYAHEIRIHLQLAHPFHYPLPVARIPALQMPASERARLQTTHPTRPQHGAHSTTWRAPRKLETLDLRLSRSRSSQQRQQSVPITKHLRNPRDSSNSHLRYATTSSSTSS